MLKINGMLRLIDNVYCGMLVKDGICKKFWFEKFSFGRLIITGVIVLLPVIVNWDILVFNFVFIRVRGYSIF